MIIETEKTMNSDVMLHKSALDFGAVFAPAQEVVGVAKPGTYLVTLDQLRAIFSAQLGASVQVVSNQPGAMLSLTLDRHIPIGTKLYAPII